MSRSLKETFYGLTADRMLNAVEGALTDSTRGRATGRILALNSLENRVQEIEFEDQSLVVAKFYRPQRWSEAQISEEHEFLEKLATAEIPVVAPLRLKPSKFAKVCRRQSLGVLDDGIFFAVFPKVRGRLLDELSQVQLETMGRYLGRIHSIGSTWIAKSRPRLNVQDWAVKSSEFLLAGDFMEPSTRAYYERVIDRFIELARPRMQSAKAITVHGDCHLGNTLWQNDSPFFLDFDDMMVAPAVQDIWMVIRGRDDEARRQREILLSTYEQMCEFDTSSLSLIEILRGLRIIYYSAWIARRLDDPAFIHAFPDFASNQYWRNELQAIEEVIESIEQPG